MIGCYSLDSGVESDQMANVTSELLPAEFIHEGLERRSHVRTNVYVGTTALVGMVALDLVSQVALWKKGSTEIISSGEVKPVSEVLR